MILSFLDHLLHKENPLLHLEKVLPISEENALGRASTVGKVRKEKEKTSWVYQYFEAKLSH
jgi:hypothetical protein